MVPFGGYTTIRFVVDNPGWWFFHCHIEIHQLEGMAAVVKESFGFEKPVNLTKQNKHIQSNQREYLNIEALIFLLIISHILYSYNSYIIYSTAQV